MKNYYIFIFFLGVFCLFLVGLGFVIVGTPTFRQGQTYDNMRISSMTTLSFKIQSYYEEHGRLPDNLSSFSEKYTLDPESKEKFEYKIVSEKSYELCTTFSSDSADYQERYNYNYGNINHNKGYDCVAFKARTTSLTVYTTTITPTNSPTPTLTPFLTVSPSRLILVDTDLQMRIVSAEKVNEEIITTVEVKNTGQKSLVADLSKVQMSYYNQSSAGSTAAKPGYSYRHEILPGSEQRKELRFKNDGQAPYTFSYVGISKTIVMATAR